MVQVSFKKVMREKKIKTLYALAKVLNYPYKSIKKLLKPTYNPRIQDLAKHAKKLKCKVRDLIKE